MFYFVVCHLRWLARIPGLPQLFDAFLLAHTWLLHRPRVVAMEAMEADALRIEDVQPHIHRFGGIEFRKRGRQLGHLHGHGLLDVVLPGNLSRTLVQTGKVRPHHVFPNSKWISFQMESLADVAFAMELIKMAERNGN